MFDPRAVAAAQGIAVEIADLGDWNGATLMSEYDPAGPVIRVNERAVEDYRARCGPLNSCDVRAFIDLAVAHELYHHREATGEIARLPTRAERERAADTFARTNVSVDRKLDAFVRAASGR